MTSLILFMFTFGLIMIYGIVFVTCSSMILSRAISLGLIDLTNHVCFQTTICPAVLTRLSNVYTRCPAFSSWNSPSFPTRTCMFSRQSLQYSTCQVLILIWHPQSLRFWKVSCCFFDSSSARLLLLPALWFCCLQNSLFILIIVFYMLSNTSSING